MSATEKRLRAVVEAFIHAIGVHLERWSFRRAEGQYADRMFTYVFRNSERYVRVSGSDHPRDYPPFLNISLGEGSSAFPDTERNSVPLWKILRASDIAHDASEYELAMVFDPSFQERVQADIDAVGRPFLAGESFDLSRFRD